jgi:putative YhdH/YhfP family quinone oxidoreductase
MTHAFYRALVVREAADGFSRQIEQLDPALLPSGDVLIQVRFSALNYKDALSASGHRGVTRRYPHTPGVDAAGVVEESRVPEFRPGDQVLVHGYDLGMNTAGGFGQMICVPAAWVVPLPPDMDPFSAMVYGTAGFTAALALQRMLDVGLAAEQGDILVTGATGGVGTLAVALLTHTGFRCVAATGKLDQSDLLAALGAAEVIDRRDLEKGSDKPLLSQRWAGVIDTVGGTILAHAIKSTRTNGVVAACGNAASAELPLTVYPFILRGVSLLGVDSATCDMARRRQLWEKLAGPWKLTGLERITRVVRLDDLDAELERILAGQQVGHVVVDLWA